MNSKLNADCRQQDECFLEKLFALLK